MHGKMVYNSCGTGKTWIFEDLDRISDSREDLGTVFRENLGTHVFLMISVLVLCSSVNNAYKSVSYTFSGNLTAIFVVKFVYCEFFNLYIVLYCTNQRCTFAPLFANRS